MLNRFVQTKTSVDRLQILSSADELFNHVDEQLPMWAGDGDRAVQKTIAFDHPFETAPNITLGLTGIDAAHDQNLRFSLDAKNVTAKDFTIDFTTWGDTHIARASVSWQAVGLSKQEAARAGTPPPEKKSAPVSPVGKAASSAAKPTPARPAGTTAKK